MKFVGVDQITDKNGNDSNRIQANQILLSFNCTTFCIINVVCLSVGKLRDLGNWDAVDTEMFFDTLQIRMEAVAQI